MSLELFASNLRLKIRRNPDDDNEPCISGKDGQIYAYTDNELCVSFMPELVNGRGVGKWAPKTWGNHRRKCVAVGMVVRQNGDSEGVLSFDPSNRKQAELALKIARVRQKRTILPERLAALRANIARARENRIGA